MKVYVRLVTALTASCVFQCNAQSGSDVGQAATPPNPAVGDVPQQADATVFDHFVAHNQTRTCTADSHARPFINRIRGVNLGGWMVLEPWITPSLFYQFLGKDENSTAFDTYSFCSVLGPEEGNRQLRRHWKTWLNEVIIDKLARSNAVNSLRLPVGDYMYKPYGPYGKHLMHII